MRVLPDGVDDATQNYVEWKAVEEGFRLIERDLGKLQVKRSEPDFTFEYAKPNFF